MGLKANNQPFSLKEFETRWQATKRSLRHRDIDSLVVTNPHNMAWLTGYAGTSSYIPQAAIFGIGQDMPILVLRKQDVPAGIHTTPLPRSHILGYPESLIGNPERDGHDFVIEMLSDLDASTRSVGIESDDVTYRTYRKYETNRNRWRVTDASALIPSLRTIKSEEEIALMREAGQIVQHATCVAFAAARPGRRECDVAGDVIKALACGKEEFETIRIEVPEMAFGQRIGTGHYHWYEGTVEHGQQINFELVGMRHLYQVPLMRTISIGQPSSRLERLYDGVRSGLEDALSVIKPGNTCADVANAFYATLNRYGFEKDSRCGYTIGLTTAENPSLQSTDHSELVPNMTFHLMCGTWPEEDFGVTVSESFRVTETGHETFSQLSRDIHIV